MVDEGVNIIDDCAACCIHFIVPPGRRGATQMIPANVNKISFRLKVCILAEQDIRCLKTFRILATKMPISTIEQFVDMLTICDVLCNFKEPIYSN